MHTLSQLQSGQLLGSKRLKLSCELSEFPKEIFDLAETLEILDLSCNKLSSLPADFAKLKHLKIAFFSDNFFTEYPTVLADCPKLEMVGFKANQISTISSEAISSNLRWLILTNNRIEAIPTSIGKCIRLQKCMLAGNRLKTLPAAMANCTNLELLRISVNQFEELPNWLLKLPKLSWLAFASNPFCASWQKSNALDEIDWHEFELKEQLGEGASGNISKAFWTDKQLDVAVKVFKGEVTSDGLPSDEMNATISAGKHPNLVSVLGKLKNHPDQKQGLVFGLIPPRYKNLGQPPSFESCTRDNYIEGTTFSSETILEISKGMASVCAHLHANGLSHSDFYAHNILIDEKNHALLGDFGAGVSYDTNSDLAPYLERLEVRAFGCLLDDLLTHASANDNSSTTIRQIDLLKEDCFQKEVQLRPSFESIYKRLLSF